MKKIIAQHKQNYSNINIAKVLFATIRWLQKLL